MEKKITRRNFLKKTTKAVTLASAAGYGFLLQGCVSKKDFDLVIKEATIFDGRGSQGFKADIGIAGEMIKSMGKISSSKGKRVIDARNLALSPGFIDIHDHTSVELLVNPRAESSIHQGITTLISGNCGSSPFPVAEETYEEQRQSLKEEFQIELNWKDIQGFFSRLEEKGISLNYATLVGQGSVRGAAMGFNDRRPSEEEMEKMKAMVAQSIEGGALGLSSGLQYTPSGFAKPEEIIELSKIAARYGGVYATHMRDEEDFVLESLDEAIDAARKSGISLQISHFKTCYPHNWEKIDRALAKIEEAKKEGIDIFCDRYPYIAFSTGLNIYFPLWAREGKDEDFLNRLKDPSLESKFRSYLAEGEKKLGSWDKVLISSVFSEMNKNLEGKNILEASKEAKKGSFEFMRDLLIEEKNRVGIIAFAMSEENLRKILAHPLVGVGTDGSAVAPYGLLGRGKPHPRLYGTFPRALGKYVREEKILPLEKMLEKITSIPAKRFGFQKRGVVENGYFADLVIFDPDKIIDQATWVNPHQFPLGVEYVLVNGQVVIERGEHTGSLPGKILKKKL